jgi:hypothetical protein
MAKLQHGRAGSSIRAQMEERSEAEQAAIEVVEKEEAPGWNY